MAGGLESVAVDVLGFRLLRDVAPGEAVLVDTAGRFHSRQCAARTVHAPCMFEFVYLARPDSIIDGVSVIRVAHEDGRVPRRQDAPHHAQRASTW